MFVTHWRLAWIQRLHVSYHEDYLCLSNFWLQHWSLPSASPAFAADTPPIVIKFSHVVAIDTPKGQAAEHFKLAAEKLTKGRVRVEVYANSSLFKSKDELEALQAGNVQMLAPSLATFGPFGVKEFEVFDLPYMFPTREALTRVTDGPIGKGLLAKLEPKGIVGLGYWDNGFKIMSANKPLHTPADYKGEKMRIQTSKVLDAQMRALGASPLEVGFAETYQALKTGVGGRYGKFAVEHADTKDE